MDFVSLTTVSGAHTFKDHFSSAADRYAAHRPTYPPALADWLASVAPSRSLAWDAGCGSGQLSVLLAERFDRVIATDASAEQIAHAEPHPKIEYRAAPAEISGIDPGTIDLAVAAQAAHWFELDAYYREVRRAARANAVVALVTYGIMIVDDEIDPVILRFYRGVLGRYWPPERKHVEDGYRSLPFPFEEIEPPSLAIERDAPLGGVLDYIDTWSAIRALEKAEGRAPVEAFREELARTWGDPSLLRRVRWPLSVRAGRIA